jgi:ATP-binding cassette subfamily B multidrug efflux pump
MGLWILGYLLLLRYFVPRAQKRSLANAEARSVTVGRIVDSYTNILTVKLFAARRGGALGRAPGARHRHAHLLHMLRLITNVTGVLAVMNSLLLFSISALSLLLWTRGR